MSKIKDKAFLCFGAVVAIFLCVVMIVSTGIVAYGASGIGDISSQIDSTLYTDGSESVVMSQISSNDGSSQQIVTVDFDPTSGSYAEVITGSSVYGGHTLTNMTDYALSEGKNIVAAINGDYFDTGDGVSFGMAIKNGKLISTTSETAVETLDGSFYSSNPSPSGSGYRYIEAFGFEEDGKAVYGDASQIAITATVNGTTKITIDQLNRRRKSGNWWGDVRLLTEDWGTYTYSEEASGGTGVDVIIKLDDASARDGLRVGGAISGTVESVNSTENLSGKSYVEIGEGKVALTSTFSNLIPCSVGDSITIDVTDDSGIWEDVVTAMGAYRILAENGEGVSQYVNYTSDNARSALGIKANGECVLFTADDSSTIAKGIGYAEVISYLIDEKDCETVIELDGGGSTQMQAVYSGDTSSTIANVPSDNGQRSLAFGLGVVIREDVTVTYKADGETVGTETVSYGRSALASVDVPAKIGYTGYWDADLSCVVEDMVVEPSYTYAGSTIGFEFAELVVGNIGGTTPGTIGVTDSMTASYSGGIMSVSGEQEFDDNTWTLRVCGLAQPVLEAKTYTETLAFTSDVTGIIQIEYRGSNTSEYEETLVALDAGKTVETTIEYNLSAGESAYIYIGFGSSLMGVTIGDFNVEIEGFTIPSADDGDDSAQDGTDPDGSGGTDGGDSGDGSGSTGSGDASVGCSGTTSALASITFALALIACSLTLFTLKKKRSTK